MWAPLKYKFWGIIFFYCFASAAAGREFTVQDSIPESNPASKNVSRHSLFVGSGYGSNLLLSGSSMSDNMPFISASLTYAFMENLWASVVLYNLPGYATTIPLYDLSAGYNHTFNDWFDISTSLSSFQTSQQMEEMLYPGFAFLTLDMGVDWMWLYTTVGIGKILDNNTGIYLHVGNSRYFSTPEFGKANSYFSFDPSVNLLFGHYQEVIVTQQVQQIRRFVRPRFIIIENQDITTTFKLMQIEFSIPVAFNTGRFTFEAEPLYLLPTIKDEAYHSLNGFHFFFNMDFRIF